MSNVTLSIAGRNYTVACAQGEEAHIAQLGAQIDERVAQMGDIGAMGEARTLLFAALLMADEAYEARKAVPASAPSPPSAETFRAEDRIVALANSLENLALRLEGRAAAS